MRVLRSLIFVVLFAAAAAVATVTVVLYEDYWLTLPPVDDLLTYEPPVATRVYAADGTLIEEFFEEKRYLSDISEVPLVVRQAFVAAEDSEFYSHYGIDPQGIFRAFVANTRAGDVVQGGSTITQQVVKQLLLSPERSYERKLREVLLALKLEQEASKDQILQLYLNQIYFGGGNYGIEAAARSYFGKQVGDLSVAEAALLAGLPQAPSRYSPTTNPKAARARQRYVLRRMVEDGFITSGTYHEALRTEVEIHPRSDSDPGVRNYYTEWVRLFLEERFGKDAPYRSGLSVYTAMDPRLQDLAQSAVSRGIERVDWMLAYRGPLEHLEGDALDERLDKERAVERPLDRLLGHRFYEAVVTEVSKSGKQIRVQFGSTTHLIDVSEVRFRWHLDVREFRAGDVVEVAVRKMADPWPPEDEKAERRLHVVQRPEIEAALVAIDVRTGHLAAMVGGYDFLHSQFNRALQARRQPGSAFKPFIYSAALDNGYTAASIVYDEPVEYMDHDEIWAPKNYSREHYGPTTLRTALEKSRNVVTVKLVDSIGVDRTVDYVEQFDFPVKIGRHLSIALGTTELPLIDLASAYTAFANKGVKITPAQVLRVEDANGNMLFFDKPRYQEAITRQTAALVTSMLRGVVERGTARVVRGLGRPAAGKTGTTNDQRDAWFLGFTPDLVVGVWIGYDDHRRSMGKPGTGGRVAAPIWLDFMKGALKNRPVSDFDIPDGIKCVLIDVDTGLRANAFTEDPSLECFKQGTEPLEYQPMWVWDPGASGSNADDATGTANLDTGGGVPEFPSAAGQQRPGWGTIERGAPGQAPPGQNPRGQYPQGQYPQGARHQDVAPPRPGQPVLRQPVPRPPIEREPALNPGYRVYPSEPEEEPEPAPPQPRGRRWPW